MKKMQQIAAKKISVLFSQRGEYLGLILEVFA
jgi:hypothetical protein